MAYLLDANILSELIRVPRGRVAEKVGEVGEAAIRTSIIVAAELRFGVHKRGSARLAENVEAVLGSLDIVPLASPVDYIYGEIRAHLERVGTPIGANDLLIAAHALALGDTLVTGNEREFARVPGINLENWLR